MSGDSKKKIIELEGEAKKIGISRKPQKTGKSWSVTVPMKELVRQAIIRGMDVVDFVKNWELCFYDVTPEGGNWLRDGETVIRWERRKTKEERREIAERRLEKLRKEDPET